MWSFMLVVLDDNGSLSSINTIYMIAVICLAYIVCTTACIVIPTTVSVIYIYIYIILVFQKVCSQY